MKPKHSIIQEQTGESRGISNFFSPLSEKHRHKTRCPVYSAFSGWSSFGGDPLSSWWRVSYSSAKTDGQTSSTPHWGQTMRIRSELLSLNRCVWQISYRSFRCLQVMYLFYPVVDNSAKGFPKDFHCGKVAGNPRSHALRGNAPSAMRFASWGPDADRRERRAPTRSVGTRNRVVVRSLQGVA